MLFHGLGLGSMSLCAAGPASIIHLTALWTQIQEQSQATDRETELRGTMDEALQVIDSLEPDKIPVWPTTQDIRKLIAKPQGLNVGVRRLDTLIQQITGQVPSPEEGENKLPPRRRHPSWIGKVMEPLERIPELPAREPTAQRMTTRHLRKLATNLISEAWPMTLQITAPRSNTPHQFVTAGEMILAGFGEALAVESLGSASALIIVDDLLKKHYVAHVTAETPVPQLVRSLKESFEILHSRRLFVLPGTNFAIESVVRIFEALNEYGVMELHERVTKLIPHKDYPLPRMLIYQGNFYDNPSPHSEPPSQ